MTDYAYLIKLRHPAEVFKICLGCSGGAAEMLDKQLMMLQVKVLIESVDDMPRADDILEAIEVRRDRQIIFHAAVELYSSLVLSLEPCHFRLEYRHVFGRHTPALALDRYVGADPE